MKTCRFRFLLLLLSFCIACTCGSQTATASSVPVLVKDIKTTIANNSNIRNLSAAGSTLLFTAFDRAHGNELWKSGGTGANTAMVKDILPGTGSSYANPFITYWNGFAYFRATGPNGLSLWKSDGTETNTVEVSQDVDPLHLVVFNGSLYFSGNSAGLWKSDGTTAGTIAISSDIGTPGNLVVAGDRLYFTILNALWVSDGTTPGTFLLQSNIYPSQLTSVNGTLYFHGRDSLNNYRLWTSNGTIVGTVALPYAADPDNLTDVNGTLFFTAWDPTSGLNSLVKLASGGTTPAVVKSVTSPSNLCNWNGILYFESNGGLWKSDGTTDNTVEVKPGISPSLLKVVGNVLYFKGRDSAYGYELWKSNGTLEGTSMVKDIYLETSNSNPDQFTNLNGTLFFTATDATSGTQLWKSNGTTAGTVMVQNISPGTQDANPQFLRDVNGTLYFAADDYTTGNKLWQTNGTNAATSMIPGFTGVNPVPLANANGMLFFAANATNLWKRDGSNVAVLVKAGVTTSDPKQVISIDGTFYFSGTDGIHGWELWKSDGTTANTVLVKDINPGGANSNSNIDYLVNLNGTLYFTALNGTDTLLWKSDGTEVGTVPVSTSVKSVTNLTVVNNKLIFSGSDSLGNNNALWVSDGTNITLLASEIWPSKLTAVGNTLFFQGTATGSGYELWKSDGTMVALVKDTRPGSVGGYPENLTNVNGTLYFSVWNTWDTPSHDQLWKSDGTTLGTVVVKDLSPDRGSTSIDLLTSVHGNLAFVFKDKNYQSYNDSAELWISDGTSAGTVMVRDIYPGNYGSDPAGLTMANTPPNAVDKEALFFSAIDQLAGREIFILDFTPPVSAITLPVNNAYLAGTNLLISGSASDSLPGTGVTLVEISIDNGVTWHNAIDTSAGGTWATWQYAWGNPVDGVYTIKSRATDLATNVQTPLASIIVTVDNTLPVSAITQPLYIRNATGTITGTTSDNLSGIEKVEVSIDGGTVWNLATVTSNTWQYSWILLPVDGTYTVKSRATDRSGNVQSPVASGTVIIDNVLPTSSITLPAENGSFHVAGTQVQVRGAAADNRSGVAKVEVSVNNGNWVTATGTTSWVISSTLPGTPVDGTTYTIKSRTTDRAGNLQNPPTIRTIIIDNTPHTLNIDLTGSGGGSVRFVEHNNMTCNTDCQTTVYAGDPVTLQATVDQYSLFGGWSNACSGSNDCIFTMPGATMTTATATFNRDTAHAVLVDQYYYPTILGAYNALTTVNGDIVGIWGVDFIETLLFNLDKQVTLRGGDNGNHTPNINGLTRVTGPMSIRNGTIRVKNLSIK